MPNQHIILKADDLRYSAQTILPDAWKRFLDYIVDQGICAGLGIVGESLATEDERYFSAVRELDETGSFEIWNHGYNHHLQRVNADGGTYCEFQNTPYEYQMEHLGATQALARDRLGLTLRCFGTPGNKCDANTRRAVENTPDIEVWLYGDPSSSTAVLRRFANIEFPAHEPDYRKFVGNHDPERDYLLLQGHPNSWDDPRFEQFHRVVQYLKERDCTFVTPHSYHRLRDNTAAR